MPVPKRKRSRTRRDTRFANKGLSPKTFVACTNCTASMMPHQACSDCGFYKGRKIFASKADRSIARAQTRKARGEAQAQSAEVQE